MIERLIGSIASSQTQTQTTTTEKEEEFLIMTFSTTPYPTPTPTLITTISTICLSSILLIIHSIILYKQQKRLNVEWFILSLSAILLGLTTFCLKDYSLVFFSIGLCLYESVLVYRMERVIRSRSCGDSAVVAVAVAAEDQKDRKKVVVLLLLLLLLFLWLSCLAVIITFLFSTSSLSSLSVVAVVVLYSTAVLLQLLTTFYYSQVFLSEYKILPLNLLRLLIFLLSFILNILFINDCDYFILAVLVYQLVSVVLLNVLRREVIYSDFGENNCKSFKEKKYHSSSSDKKNKKKKRIKRASKRHSTTVVRIEHVALNDEKDEGEFRGISRSRTDSSSTTINNNNNNSNQNNQSQPPTTQSSIRSSAFLSRTESKASSTANNSHQSKSLDEDTRNEFNASSGISTKFATPSQSQDVVGKDQYQDQDHQDQVEVEATEYGNVVQSDCNNNNNNNNGVIMSNSSLNMDEDEIIQSEEVFEDDDADEEGQMQYKVIRRSREKAVQRGSLVEDDDDGQHSNIKE